ncbi:MAG: GvpL/GvpF family gas vesicle protein [candidate division NC10 bacterium]|nr:GvpL/GvpF family gas vesicle protein [candidate division NC10 bacterium]
MADETEGRATPAPENGVGWYVYGVIPWSVEVPVTAGIEEGRAVAFIFEGPIMAVASPVSLGVFDSEPLRRNMEDPHWLAEKVCQHEAVVEAMLAKGPVLPMKFCTIFRSPDAVRRMLREHAPRFQEALELVRDKEEWGVKGFAHRGYLREATLRRDPELREMAEQLARSAPDRPGSAFFLKRRMDDLAEQRRMEREAELLREAAEALRGSVVQLTSNPPLRGQRVDNGAPVSTEGLSACLPAGAAQAGGNAQAGGHTGEEVVLNLACLVLRQGVQTFLAEVQRWNEARADQGLRLVASGPWPPYNFSPRFGSHAG